MTVREALLNLKDKLKAVEDGDTEASYILENACSLNRTQLIFCYGDEISQDAYEKAFSMADRRLSSEPIQYILGLWDFMGFSFEIGEGVLIPRPETEILVEKVLERIKSINEPVIFDLCSGSGCIGLSIKKIRTDAKVFLVEKSDDALFYLKNNCRKLCGELNDTTVIQGDILQFESFDGLPHADVIVSNPPYIRSNEIPGLQSEVLREPHLALDGGEDGLIFYRVLVNKWSKKLKSEGFMAFECGENQANDICDLFAKINFDKEIINDYNNIQRIVTGRRKLNDF